MPIFLHVYVEFICCVEYKLFFTKKKFFTIKEKINQQLKMDKNQQIEKHQWQIKRKIIRVKIYLRFHQPNGY